MSKVLYLIPWFLEKTTFKRYSALKTFLHKAWFKVISVEIDRKRKTMNDYVEDFLSTFNQHGNLDEVFVLWFSFWAMISFISSTKLEVKAQFLCSLSPYFKEDIPSVKEQWKKALGKKRLKVFNDLWFDELSPHVKCKTYIFYGTKEWPEIAKRSKDANTKIYESELLIIEWAKHDLSEKQYIATIKEVVSKAIS
jgi:hypothetical protein